MSTFPRYHLVEINDQPWLPDWIRERVQECLTLLWTLNLAPLQEHSPASLVAGTLAQVLGVRCRDYTFVDFCAGAGGPTPFIEKEFKRGAKGLAAKFVLTDIEPHLSAWRGHSSSSPHILYIATPVDATEPPSSTTLANMACHSSGKVDHDSLQRQKTFRLFFLALHHLDQAIAQKVLRNALSSPDCAGIGIFELQGRTLGEISMVCMLGPVLWVVAPWYFWRDPLMLFLVYILPVVPFIVVVDGIVSCLRTRTAEEILGLIEESGASCEGWEFKHGSRTHNKLVGEMHWFIALRS
ncbi:hypothetical protein M409DRAFT_67744 [Zasmidium cellare ATCC 36951]|uniref:Methyltransferase domain-containing protein n=1 Tax=Zasmidium cellare ATCC 36951 TaxID=1080233 RepID=A0A6A6CBP0_ZASCE|nr:uncharacterized protein M409DRAFT_67744 [Zasmidium cellare ATCC 36951]KAF2164607.1 hypothetical protein M409DRAFT_67744 [Zasmidium cellare ATCC 36951]